MADILDYIKKYGGALKGALENELAAATTKMDAALNEYNARKAEVSDLTSFLAMIKEQSQKTVELSTTSFTLYEIPKAWAVLGTDAVYRLNQDFVLTNQVEAEILREYPRISEHNNVTAKISGGLADADRKGYIVGIQHKPSRTNIWCKKELFADMQYLMEYEFSLAMMGYKIDDLIFLKDKTKEVQK